MMNMHKKLTRLDWELFYICADITKDELYGNIKEKFNVEKVSNVIDALDISVVA